MAIVCGSAAAESPEVIEERRAVGIVEMIRMGDAEALLTCMHENWILPKAGDDRETRWNQIAKGLTGRHAGLEIVGIIADEPHCLTIRTSEPEGNALRFIFDFETGPPHRIISMSVELGDDRGGTDLSPLELPAGADSELIAAALSSWFGELAEEDLFSGTSLIALRGQPIFTGAWGLANREWSVPNSVDTRFDLGSINKSFTQVAIGQLINQGKLSLDNTIGDLLPDYPNPEVAGKVTIRHLIEHSSGLGDIFTDEFFRSSKALYRGPRDFFWLFADRPLLFEPGERFEYSNAGFMVLGAIIEAASGEPYDQYITRHVFEPAGMTNSGFFANDEPVPNVAVGYTRMGREEGASGLRNNLFHLPVKGNSAGSAQSTVEDLLRFDTALREHQLLPPAYTEWYFGGDEPDTAEQSKIPGERATVAVGIAGGAPGVSAVLESDGDLAVIILSNYDPPIAETVARSLFRPLKRVLENDE
jgi:CubicO group peptidase (beta-lactamase class C family)